MTHDELVQAAVHYLWNRERCCVVITEMVSVARETPDAIGWRSMGFPVLIECKTSKADFRADRKKFVRRLPEWGMGCHRYFCVPKGLVSSEEIPKGWGLIEVSVKSKVRRVIESQIFESNARDEIGLLLSAIRRIGHDAPQGYSVRCYTTQTKQKATLGLIS